MTIDKQRLAAAVVAVTQARQAEAAHRDAYQNLMRRLKRNDRRLTLLAVLRLQVQRVERWTEASVASAAARRRLVALEEALLDLEGL